MDCSPILRRLTPIVNINKDDFKKTINPSFGYLISESRFVNYILRYDEYLIQSEIGNTLNTGQYNFNIKRTSSNDYDVIKFTSTGGKQDTIILTSG